MVEYVSVNDFYEIRLASLLSNVDKDVLIELYQPIIGSASTILYLTLLKQKRNAEEDEIYSSESLSKVMQVSMSGLLNARQYLEGVGLLKTYMKEENGKRLFIFLLYAPKSPRDFFDDILFKGLLIQAIGEKAALALASKYEIDLTIPEGYKEVTASFNEMFTPDYNDPSFRKDISGTIIGHKTRKLKLEFSYDKFFEFVEENSQIRRSVFDNKMMIEIERITSLYSLDEKTMAFIIIDAYKPYENPHLNFEEVIDIAKDSIKLPTQRNTKRVSSKETDVINSESNMSKKIKIMDEKSPVKYLSMLQNNTKPSNGDIAVVDKLSTQYGFSNGVINAIIEYTLTKCNNVLNAKYADRVASGVAREGASNALETMNYLRNNKARGQRKIVKEEIQEEEKKTEPVVSNETISDDEMDDILASIAKKRGGK